MSNLSQDGVGYFVSVLTQFAKVGLGQIIQISLISDYIRFIYVAYPYFRFSHVYQPMKRIPH